MNVSNVSHGVLALAIQSVMTLIALVVGANLLTAATIGAALAVGFYWGREVAQV